MITLAQLDKYTGDLLMAAPPKAVAACILPDLIEYARERAAREACIEAGPKPGLVSLFAVANEDDSCKWVADWAVPFRTVASSDYQPTPTEAYLALLTKLEAAK